MSFILLPVITEILAGARRIQIARTSHLNLGWLGGIAVIADK